MKQLFLLFIISVLSLTSCAMDEEVVQPEVYTIVYNSNGAEDGRVPVDKSDYHEGDEASILGNVGELTKSNKAFLGWNTVSDGSGTTYYKGDKLIIGAEDVNLYANWSLFFQVTYNSNDADSGSVPIDTTFYFNEDKVIVIGNVGELKKQNSYFSGWNTAADGSGTCFKEGESFVITGESITLYADWSNLNKISYNSNGANSGSVPVDESTYMAMEEVQVLENSGNLSKPRLIFTGWNTKADGSGEEYLPGDFLTIQTDVTLFANWEVLQLKTFSIENAVAEIKSESQFVFVKVPYNTDLSSIKASFTTNGDTVAISGVLAKSDETSVDYSADVTLSVSYKESETKDYTVRVFTTVTRLQLDQMIIDGDNISRLDVSVIEDMSSLFKSLVDFNQDLSLWDVSNVKDMSYMFQDADSFCYDISGWDVSSVTSMRGMFRSNDSFNQNIGSWDVGSVEDMSYMFWNADSFNQNINAWNVSNVTEMKAMFKSTDVFNQELHSWNFAKVEEVSEMFYGALCFNQNISSWSDSLSENVLHENFSGGSCPLLAENLPYTSWQE